MSLILTRPAPARLGPARGPDPIGLAAPVAGLLTLLALVDLWLAAIPAAGLLAVNLALWLSAPRPGAMRDCASPERRFRS